MIKYLFIMLLFLIRVAAAEVDLTEMQNIKSRLQDSVNAPGNDCIECEHDAAPLEYSKQIHLDSKNEEIKTRYRGGSKPYVVNIIRAKGSPERVELKVQYYQRFCAENLSRLNPLTGRLSSRCLVHKSKKREKTVHVDFRKAPKLASDEEEIYQVKLSKKLDQESIDDHVSLIDGDGKNVEIKLEKSFLGLFGQRYVVE